MDENIVGTHEWHNHTTLHPVGLVSALVLGVLLISLPRRYAIFPMIVLVCFIPSAQRLVVFGADFTLLRVLIVFGWLRLFIRSEFRGLVWNRLDKLVVIWMVTAALLITLRLQYFSIFINQCGTIFDGLGMYILFRCILREWKDVELMILFFIYVSIPVAMFFLVERATGRNMFSVFGGVPAITVVRDGSLRCQGAYSHAILAGTFWASLLPLFLALWGTARKAVITGIVTSAIVILMCASSTPVMSVGFVLFGLGLYPVRQYVRAIRWSFLLVLVVIHFSWHHPVWYLIAKMNIISGSTGYHRFVILDTTLNHFSSWWVCGTSDMYNWGVWQMRDITNQYVGTALNGGLLSLVLFIAVIAVAFGVVGTALRRCDDAPSRRTMVWCVGIMLFVHVCSFFAVSYFGQIIMLIYLTLALCASLEGMVAFSIQESNAECNRKTPDLSKRYWKRI